ncbi:MAG TPA: hypothetical protein VIG53_04730, partial [Actinomycetota bacterium]
ALVVDTGAQATSFCVALDRASVSGTHLIELASAQYGLSYRLGFGGRAVCMLDGVGATGNDCFGGYPNFWGYFHGAGSSGWTWASGSAADHQVGNGDREAWSWGAGDSGTSHGAPPATTIDDACGVAPPPDPSPSPSSPPSATPPTPSPSGGGGSSNADGSNAGGGTDPGGGSNAGGQGSGQTSQHSATPEPSTSPSPTAAAPTSASPAVVRAAAAAPPPSSGPPLAGIVALGAVALLGAGGVAAMRRRRGPG